MEYVINHLGNGVHALLIEDRMAVSYDGRKYVYRVKTFLGTCDCTTKDKNVKARELGYEVYFRDDENIELSVKGKSLRLTGRLFLQQIKAKEVKEVKETASSSRSEPDENTAPVVCKVQEKLRLKKGHQDIACNRIEIEKASSPAASPGAISNVGESEHANPKTNTATSVANKKAGERWHAGTLVFKDRNLIRTHKKTYSFLIRVGCLGICEIFISKKAVEPDPRGLVMKFRDDEMIQYRQKGTDSTLKWIKGSDFSQLMQQKQEETVTYQISTDSRKTSLKNVEHVKYQTTGKSQQKNFKFSGRLHSSSKDYGSRWQYQYKGPIPTKSEADKYNNNIEDNYELFSR